MGKLEDLERLKASLQNSKEWYGYIGKSDCLSKGYLHSFKINKGATKVHYQPSKGANNYHDLPHELSEFLEQAIVEKFDELVKSAIAKQTESYISKASAILSELDEIKLALEQEVQTNLKQVGE